MLFRFGGGEKGEASEQVAGGRFLLKMEEGYPRRQGGGTRVARMSAAYREEGGNLFVLGPKLPQDFHSCYRTPWSLKGSLKRFRRVLEGVSRRTLRNTRDAYKNLSKTLQEGVEIDDALGFLGLYGAQYCDTIAAIPHIARTFSGRR